MRYLRIMLSGILLAGVIAFVATLLDLRVLAMTVLAVQIVSTGGVMMFGRRRKPADQPSGPTPEQRAAKVIALSESIGRLASEVRSGKLKASLLRGCELVPELVEYTRQNDPDHLASTSARLSTYMLSVEATLQQYLSMQRTPKADTPRMLFEAGKVLERFPEFMLTSKAQLETGDLASYRANLEVIEPMTQKGIAGPI